MTYNTKNNSNFIKATNLNFHNNELNNKDKTSNSEFLNKDSKEISINNNHIKSNNSKIKSVKTSKLDPLNNNDPLKNLKENFKKNDTYISKLNESTYQSEESVKESINLEYEKNKINNKYQ